MAKKTGGISIEAGPKELEKMNEFYGKEITQAELIRTVYPEALEVIPEEVLKEFENVRFVIGQDDTKSSIESGPINDNSVAALPIIVYPSSSRSGAASNQTYSSQTSASQVCAYLSTTSTLEKQTGGSVVCVSSEYEGL